MEHAQVARETWSPTASGRPTVVTLTGCGVGAGNKVLMVVQLADRPVVIGIYMQGLATIENLQPAGAVRPRINLRLLSLLLSRS